METGRPRNFAAAFRIFKDHMNLFGPNFQPRKIVSGGQTGVDRGALDAAINLGIAHGGWCPLGRLAEDGIIPSLYELDEMPTAAYAARTEQNVIDSDATLILYERRLTGGTLLTRKIAVRIGKPFLSVRFGVGNATEIVRDWLSACEPKVLNVAGPRESLNPGIHKRAREFMTVVLR